MTRRPFILTIAALAGLLLVWLMLVRVPQSPTSAAPPKPIARAPAPAPAQTVATPPAEPVASKPAEPVREPAAATEKKPPDPEKPTIAALEKPADDGADKSGDDSEPEDSGPPAIDTDHATDLLADMIAGMENQSEGDHLPNTTLQTLKKFDQESADANWAENAEQHIEATLGAWLDALPADAQPHVALIHVECRESLCQVLAADNDPGTADERANAGHEWQQAIASLPQQSWWHELGFVDLNTQVKPSADHVLYMSYLLREIKAPPADAPPDTGDGGNTDGG